MIIEIDGIFFNPLTISYISESGGDVLVDFCGDGEQYLRFENWTCYNLAARINELIEEFNKK